jgi:hypothetical protein
LADNPVYAIQLAAKHRDGDGDREAHSPRSARPYDQQSESSGASRADEQGARCKTACLAIRFLVGSRLIIPLIIQTIRRGPSGSDQIDEASNMSRPDRSGADQSDAEQATDLAVRGSHPSRRVRLVVV